MARKATDLREAMLNQSRGARPAPAPPDPAEPAPNPHYRPGRAGKSNVTAYFPPSVKKQLRVLAAERETTIQNLVGEALNDLFAKNGLPEIAPVER